MCGIQLLANIGQREFQQQSVRNFPKQDDITRIPRDCVYSDMFCFLGDYLLPVLWQCMGNV